MLRDKLMHILEIINTAKKVDTEECYKEAIELIERMIKNFI